MSGEPEPGADLIRELVEAEREAARERSRRHQEVRESPPYQEQLARLGLTTHAFLGTLSTCAFAASRDPSLPEASLFLRNLDDLSESATMAAFAFREGGLNSGRRELRFMLELAVQSLYVDESMGTAPFEHRVVFFEKKTKNTSVDHVKDLALTMLGTSRDEFAAATVRAWARASQYVHPTPQQLREKLDLRKRGVTPGCDTPDQLRACVDELFAVEAIIVVLAFHAVGPSFTGDILVSGGLDSLEGWPFHANRFVAGVDEFFDYKHERQAALADIRARRQSRLARQS